MSESSRQGTARKEDDWAAGGIRWLVIWLMAIQILIAVANLPLMATDERSNSRWRLEEATRTTLSPPAPRVPGPWREAVRFVKQQVDLDREANIATWLPTVLLGAIGLVAWLLCGLRRRRAWLVVALAFACLSCDEMAQIHEWIGERLAVAGWRLGAMDAPYPWVMLLGPVLAAFAIWMLRFLREELRDAPALRRRALLATVLFLLVLPVEIVGGHLQGRAPYPPRLEVIIEETLETLAETLTLGLFLTLAARELQLRTRQRAGQEAAAGTQTP